MQLIGIGKGQFAKVDDHRWAEIEAIGSWCLIESGYAIAWFRGQNIFMHQLVYSFIDPAYQGVVDHRDLDKLNNLEENLRPATKTLDNANKELYNNTSGVKGVYWNQDARRWRAFITVNRQRIHLGSFDSRQEAMETRLAASIRFFGEYRRE